MKDAFVFDDHKQLNLLELDMVNPAECKSSDTSLWRMYIDGASRSNPGKAGAGFCLYRSGKVVIEQGFFIGQRTNNQAEYFALLLGLFCAQEYIAPGESLLVFSDSQLLVRQMTGVYKIRDPFLHICKDLANQLSVPFNITFCHIYREHNFRADFLANRGIDKMTGMPKKFLVFLEKNNIT